MIIFKKSVDRENKSCILLVDVSNDTNAKRTEDRMSKQTKNLKIMGINDDSDTCECCGKTNLKKVVWIAEADIDGNVFTEPVAYGTTCAGKILGVRKRSQKAVESELRVKATDTINTHIRNLRANWRIVHTENGSMFCPAEFIDLTTIDPQSARVAIRSQYPILEFLDGNLTIEAALEIIKNKK